MIRAEQRSSGTVSGLISLGIVASAIIGFLIFDRFRVKPAVADDARQNENVLTVDAKPHTDGFVIEVDGLVVPYREIDLPAEVAGRIVSKSEHCRAGHFVEAGEVLYQIDKRDYELEVERLKQQLKQAEVMLTELQQQISGNYELLKLADEEVVLRKRELQRIGNLGNAITATDRDQATAMELQARHSWRRLQNELVLLQSSQSRLESGLALVRSQLDRAELDLKRTDIISPVSGVVVTDLVEKDDYVQKGAVLTQIEDTSKAEVHCKLQMLDLYWIWNNQMTELGPSTEPKKDSPYQLPRSEDVRVIYSIAGLRGREYEWKGRLDRFDGFGLDSTTRTVPCRVVVDKPERGTIDGPPALLRGMYVSIRIHVRPQLRLLSIPTQALRPGNQVWRVRNNTLDIVDVEYVRTIPAGEEDRIENDDSPTLALIHVEDPELLTGGDAVVITPLSFVRSQLPVEASPYRAEVSEQ